MNRCAPFRSGLGEHEIAGAEFENGETDFAGRFYVPAETAGDHQMDDDEELVLELDHDPLADAAHAADAFAFDLGGRGVDGAKDERAEKADAIQRRAGDA